MSTQPSQSQSAQLTPEKLNVIRFSLLIGVLALGVVAWFISRGEMQESAAVAETATMLRLFFYAMAVGVAAGLFFVYGK